MTLHPEPGRPEDACDIVPLIIETDPALFHYISAGDLDAFRELVALEWNRPAGVYAHSLSQVIRSRGQVIGMTVGYPVRERPLSAIRFGLGQPPSPLIDRVNHAFQLAGYLFPAVPDTAWYLQNICISQAARGQGLGRVLMEDAFERARANGCTSCHLDVNSSNPAFAFYRRIGMTLLVETGVPPLEGQLPRHYRMVKPLDR